MLCRRRERSLLYMHCLDLVLGFCQPQPTKPKRQWSHRISMYVPELCLPQPTKPKRRWSHRISMYVPELFLPQPTKPKRWCALYMLKFKTVSTYILSIVIVYALLTWESAYIIHMHTYFLGEKSIVTECTVYFALNIIRPSSFL